MKMGSLALDGAKTISNFLMRTPTCNRALPQVLAEFSSLAEGLDYAALGLTGLNFYSGRGALD